MGSLYSEPNLSFMSQPKPLSAFDQALMDLYFNHPELLEPPLAQPAQSSLFVSSYGTYLIKNKRIILQTMLDYLALAYCCYGIRNNYIHNYMNAKDCTIFNYNIEEIVRGYCPSLIRTMPAHIGFFMQTLELILKIYLFKTATKIAVYLLI